MNYKEAQKIIDTMTPEQIDAAQKVYQAKSCMPITGRYSSVNEVFEEHGSEFALMKYRVWMEVSYLEYYFKYVKKSEATAEKIHTIGVFLVKDFSMKHFSKIKELEDTTRHDVKAVEYFLREVFKKANMKYCIPYIHIGCTSEDCNNMAYAAMISNCLHIWKSKAAELCNTMSRMARRYKSTPMLGHTHGQPATPLTFGLALAVDCNRMFKSLEYINSLKIEAKFNGAVGNMAALKAAHPEIDWMEFSEKFVGKNGFSHNPLTTQIEPHDYMVRIFNEVRLFTDIVSNTAQNLWHYIQFGYLKQHNKKGEVGSSTMPHKINPIDSENAWSNAVTTEFAAMGLTSKLPVSLMQRDLSDSSTLRTTPTVFLHSYQAIQSLIKMLDRIDVNEEVMLRDLEDHPEVLSEAIQTVLRANGCPDAYEKMKEMTRGKKVTLSDIREFISTLDIDPAAKEWLMKLEPKDYIGYSAELVEKYLHR